MSDDQEQKQEPTSISPQPEAENKKQSTELSEEELKKATGGTPEQGPSESLSLNYGKIHTN